MILNLHSFRQDNISLASLNASVFVDFFREVACICGPNVFVLISGYWGMKLNPKKFCWLLFEVMFFVLGLYTFALVIGSIDFNVKDFLMRINTLPCRYYWFITVYIMLYAISPILNTFVEHTDLKSFRRTLLFFFAFQTYYSIFPKSALEFNGGYTLVSMSGLYILGRYIKQRIWKDAFLSFSSKFYLFFTIVLVAIQTCYVLFIRSYFGVDNAFIVKNVLGGLSYHNPIVILLTTTIFMWFANIKVGKFQSAINYVGSSCLAVYLLQHNPDAGRYFYEIFYSLYEYDIISHYMTLAFLFIIIFAIAVFADKICQKLYQRIWPYLERIFTKVSNHAT